MRWPAWRDHRCDRKEGAPLIEVKYEVLQARHRRGGRDEADAPLLHDDLFTWRRAEAGEALQRR
jgi:hypothetical protein